MNEVDSRKSKSASKDCSEELLSGQKNVNDLNVLDESAAGSFLTEIDMLPAMTPSFGSCGNGRVSEAPVAADCWPHALSR
ncbi:MAG: hypothetical protein KDA79_06635, partial [Planctomycetaceae bacterium]|nr:hypothetical protein [Planctomycetaceae bacterium]